jgi:hypothetical protein
LPEGCALAAPPGAGSGLAAGGGAAGLAGGAGSGLAAGRAGSADLPAHAPASKTAVIEVARIHPVIVITAR